MMRLFRGLKIAVIAYAALGILIWVVCLSGTNYKDIHIDKGIIGDDGSVSYVWDKHDNRWDYYFKYTLPFQIATLPVSIGISSLVSEGKINFWQYDIINLYLLFIPIILLLIVTVLKNSIWNMFAILFKRDNGNQV